MLRIRLPTTTPGTSETMTGIVRLRSGRALLFPERSSITVLRSASSNTYAGLMILFTRTRRARGTEIDEYP